MDLPAFGGESTTDDGAGEADLTPGDDEAVGVVVDASGLSDTHAQTSLKIKAPQPVLEPPLPPPPDEGGGSGGGTDHDEEGAAVLETNSSSAEEPPAVAPDQAVVDAAVHPSEPAVHPSPTNIVGASGDPPLPPPPPLDRAVELELPPSPPKEHDDVADKQQEAIRLAESPTPVPVTPTKLHAGATPPHSPRTSEDVTALDEALPRIEDLVDLASHSLDHKVSQKSYSFSKGREGGEGEGHRTLQSMLSMSTFAHLLSSR